MKLQHALDYVHPWTENAVVEYLHPLAESLDIIEIGTPLIQQFGMNIVRTVRSSFPDSTLLADSKIIDGGEMLAAFALDAGADLVTVMGCADRATIANVIKTAHQRKKKAVVDMMCNQNLTQDGKEILAMGADFICIHIAHDALDVEKMTDSVEKVIKSVDCGHLSISGGINISSIRKLKKYNPEIIIVGSSINTAENRSEMIVSLKTAYNNQENI